jgi:hypothetical protein
VPRLTIFDLYNNIKEFYLDRYFGGQMAEDYSNKLQDSLYWWLGRKRPFIINNEYSVELLFIDKVNNSAKIRITNLKTGSTEEVTNPLEVADERS